MTDLQNFLRYYFTAAGMALSDSGSWCRFADVQRALDAAFNAGIEAGAKVADAVKNSHSYATDPHSYAMGACETSMVLADSIRRLKRTAT